MLHPDAAPVGGLHPAAQDGVLGRAGGGADVHEQDPAGVEDDGSGVAREVVPVPGDGPERAPGAAAVRRPLQDDVDVAVVGGGVDPALAEGEQGGGGVVTGVVGVRVATTAGMRKLA